MIPTGENILLIGSILIFVGIMISRAGYKLGLPALLLFLVAGMLFGSDGIGIEFNNFNQTRFAGMVALCVILFTGGMGTDFKRIRGAAQAGITLSTLGVLLTTLITGFFVFWMSRTGWLPKDMPIVVCLLLAATMSSTDSASVFNILRTNKIGIRGRSKDILELESGSNDPMAYVLTIILIGIASGEGVLSGGMLAWNSIKILLLQFIVGIGVGAGAGMLLSWMLNKIPLDNSALRSIMLLSLVFFTFSICGMLEGNSYLAVYIAGIIIGNRRVPGRKQMMSFLDGMTWLMQIIMFLLLGLVAEPRQMLHIAPVALLIGAVMIFLARPVSVFLSLIPCKNVSFRSRVFISWVGLKGAAPLIFAIYPIVAGTPYADTIFNVVFVVTLLSLILQGSSIGYMAKLLKLSSPEEEDESIAIDIPDEIGDSEEYVITASVLKNGNTLKELKLPEGKLVIMIKRGKKYIVPNGSLELLEGDRLMIISIPVEKSEKPSEPPSPFI